MTSARLRGNNIWILRHGVGVSLSEPAIENTRQVNGNWKVMYGLMQGSRSAGFWLGRNNSDFNQPGVRIAVVTLGQSVSRINLRDWTPRVSHPRTGAVCSCVLVGLVQLPMYFW